MCAGWIKRVVCGLETHLSTGARVACRRLCEAVPKEDGAWARHAAAVRVLHTSAASLRSRSGCKRLLREAAAQPAICAGPESAAARQGAAAAVRAAGACATSDGGAEIGLLGKEEAARMPSGSQDGASRVLQSPYKDYLDLVRTPGAAEVLHRGVVGVRTSLQWSEREQSSCGCVVNSPTAFELQAPSATKAFGELVTQRLLLKCGRQAVACIDVVASRHNAGAAADSGGVTCARLAVCMPLTAAASMVARMPREFSRGGDEGDEKMAQQPGCIELSRACNERSGSAAGCSIADEEAACDLCLPWLRHVADEMNDAESSSSSSDDGVGLWR